MKYNKYLNLALVIAGMVSATSCVDMDLTSKKDQTSGSVWNDENTAQAVLTGCYNAFRGIWGDCGNNWPENMGSQIDREPARFTVGLLRGTQTASEDWGNWSMYYHQIFDCNSVIDHVKDVPDIDPALASKWASEARVIRCYNYYIMNVEYGGVPWYGHELVDIDNLNEPRGTREETFRKIIADLTLAIEDPDFPDKLSAASSDYGHVNKGMAYMLRGFCYMWLQEWDKGEADFRSVGKCGFRLYTSGQNPFKELFTVEQERCDEMIFSIQYDLNGSFWDQNGYQRSYGTRSARGWGWANYVANPYFVDTFENADGSRFDWEDVIPGYTTMDKKARRVFFLRDGLTDAEKAYQAEQGADMSKYLPEGNEARIRKAYDNRDPRLEMSIITPYAQFIGGNEGIARTYTLRFPFRADKKKPWDILYDKSDQLFYLVRKNVTEGIEHANHLGGNELDHPLFRYAEALLCLAECLNEQGKVAEAVEVVNQIRSRCGAQLLNSNAATQVKDQDDMRRRIRNEFKWELFAENEVYWHELRWDTWKDDKFGTYEGEPNGWMQVWGVRDYYYKWGGDHYKLYPIPQEEILKNHNLVQNPGW